MNGILAKILIALVTVLALGSYGVTWNLYGNLSEAISRIENRIDGIYQILLSEDR